MTDTGWIPSGEEFVASQLLILLAERRWKEWKEDEEEEVVEVVDVMRIWKMIGGCLLMLLRLELPTME
jgi:hypothetical protein